MLNKTSPLIKTHIMNKERQWWIFLCKEILVISTRFFTYLHFWNSFLAFLIKLYIVLQAKISSQPLFLLSLLMGGNNSQTLRGCLVFKKPSLITSHSIFVTHHLKYPNFPNPTCLAPNSALFLNFKNLKMWDPFLKLKNQKLRLTHSKT